MRRTPTRRLGLLLMLVAYGSSIAVDYAAHRPTRADPEPLATRHNSKRSALGW